MAKEEEPQNNAFALCAFSALSAGKHLRIHRTVYALMERLQRCAILYRGMSMAGLASVFERYPLSNGENW